MGVFTKYRRVAIKHKTGTGKSLTALGLAVEFIKKFQIMYDMNEPYVGNVIIMGFNIKSIFYRELMRFPELGFISPAEIMQFKELKNLAQKGTTEDVNRLKEFQAAIVRRFYKKKIGGFFHIFGYKEFVNHLFIPNADIQLSSLSNEQIAEYLDSGKLLINQTIVNMFKNSVLICDEIHNVYNSLEKNNYGVALQTILDKLPCLKAIFMSATLLNNSPAEYIDLQNLLLPPEKRIKHDDIFTKDNQLLPMAEEKIANLMRGRISFFQDEDPTHFPTMTFEGETIPIPNDVKYENVRKVYKEIPYLKFVRCPMSKLHYSTYNEVYDGVLSIDDHSLDDMVLPRPPNSPIQAAYNTHESKKAIKDATQKWRDTAQITTYEENGTQFTGEFLKMPHLAEYSTKYAQMVQTVRDIIASPSESGKILIYHPYVSMSGVMFIREIFRKNGLIDLGSEVTENTICAHCGLLEREHRSQTSLRTGAQNSKRSKTNVHSFSATRMILAHGSVDKNTLTAQRDMINSPENVDGARIYMLIGSSAIREGFNLMAFRHLLVMSRDNNISQLIQLLGRPNRYDSHIQLPPEKQTIKVRIFVSSIPSRSGFSKARESGSAGELSHEEDRYLWKLMDFAVIQKIEKVFHTVAVDGTIYRDLIQTGLSTGQSKTQSKDVASLSPLFFLPEKVNKLPIKKSTFYAFHVDDEINTIKYIIKRLFVEKSPVWKYSSLWRAVQSPYFYVQFEPSQFEENNFIVALTNLIWDYTTHSLSFSSSSPNHGLENTNSANSDSTSLINKLFNSERDIITKNGQRSAIVQVGEYYILFPLVHTQENKETSIEPSVDVEACYRDVREIPSARIGIKKFITNSNSLFDYSKQKVTYHAKYKNVDMSKLSIAICEYTTDFHVKFLEDAIQYIFNIWTRPFDIDISEFHDFYYKMVQFYGSLELVVNASSIIDMPIVDNYKKYINLDGFGNSSDLDKISKDKTSDDAIDNPKKDAKLSKLAKSSVLALLKSSIEKSTIVNEIGDPQLDEQKLKVTLAKSQDHYAKSKKLKTIIRTDPTLLPVGHILDSEPRFYNPETQEWNIVSDYHDRLSGIQYKENPVIIGYYEKSNTGMAVRFKLRKPIQNITFHTDTRLIEKGSVCTSSKKHDLMDIMKKLGIKNFSGIKDICNAIRVKLIENEIKERRSGTNIKWFYHLIEKQPIDLT